MAYSPHWVSVEAEGVPVGTPRPQSPPPGAR
jgi:hypothetical protein